MCHIGTGRVAGAGAIYLYISSVVSTIDDTVLVERTNTSTYKNSALESCGVRYFTMATLYFTFDFSLCSTLARIADKDFPKWYDNNA